MDQREILYNYNYDNRPRLSHSLLYRDDDEIIDELMKVIKSCERDRFYTIKVLGHRVVDSPIEINRLLREHEEARINKNKATKRNENQYDYISLKDSKIRLLIVTYYVKGFSEKGEEEEITFDVYICVPRLVDRYFFKIAGNLYTAMYQIVDGSTYNNSNSSSKRHSVTLKTIFQPIKIFRKQSTRVPMYLSNGQALQFVYYDAKIFNTTTNVFKYIIARYGLIGSMVKMNLNYIYVTDNILSEHPNYYIIRKFDLFIRVPKFLYDNDYTMQAFVFAIYQGITKNTTLNELYTTEYWLGLLNGKGIPMEGLKLLDSLEGLYDRLTYESIRLPAEQKETIYDILIWMVREFSQLRLKDNMDLSTKRVRLGSAIASLYAVKLARGIHRISGKKKVPKASYIKKAINTLPNQLLTDITKCNLVSYKSNVNDLDSILALKFSYKGISGIGEGSGSVVSIDQRHIHPSYLGRVDLDASSPSDPGLTGVFTALCEITEDGYFADDYREPNGWTDNYNSLVNKYKELAGLKDVIIFKDAVEGTNSQTDIEMLNEDLRVMNNLIKPVYDNEVNSEIVNEPIMDIDTGLVYE